jgi:hypothetical protein
LKKHDTSSFAAIGAILLILSAVLFALHTLGQTNEGIPDLTVIHTTASREISETSATVNNRGGSKSAAQTQSRSGQSLSAPTRSGNGFQLRTAKFRYHYNQLNAEEQKAYNTILQKIESFPAEIQINALNSESVFRVYNALRDDQPLFFHLSGKASYRKQGSQTCLLPDYTLTPDEYKTQRAQLLAVCEELIGAVPVGADPYQKELFLHDALVRRCGYEFSNKPVQSTAYGALVSRRAACEGYAKAMLLLLDHAGIQSYMVSGDAQNSANKLAVHAWNKVRINGAWYHLDATWDDPVGSEIADKMSHAYFNITDGEIARSHTLTDAQNPCASTADMYFVRENLLFETLDRSEESVVAAAITKALNAGETSVEIKFTSETAFEDAKIYLFDKARIYRVLSNAASQTDISIDKKSVTTSENTDLFIIGIAPCFS